MGVPPAVITGNTNSAAIASGTSATVSSTGSVPKGALMCVVLMVGGSSAPSALTPPAGWTTSQATILTASGGLIALAVFTLINAAAGSFSGSFSWTGTATSGEWAFFAINYPGPGPLDGSVATSQNASGTKTSPSVTPGTGQVNDLLIGGIFGGVVGTDTITVPAGMTQIVNVAGTASVAFFAIASLKLSSSGATGTKTWTIPTSRTCLGVSFLVQEQVGLLGAAGGGGEDSDDEVVRHRFVTVMVPYIG